MKGKSPLTEMAREPFFDNTVGNSLLFDARTGTLRTEVCRAKCKKTETTCSACGEDSEETETATQCKGLHPAPPAEFDLFRPLGFFFWGGRKKYS